MAGRTLVCCGAAVAGGAKGVEVSAEVAGGGWEAGKSLVCHNKEFEIYCESSWEGWEGLKWG